MYEPEPTYRHGTVPKAGVLLINLGTPDAPTATAVRPYLKEFLSDPRVVELPRLLWWPILNLVILNTRPAKSAEKYAQIWTAEGSPLMAHSERQAKLLRGYLGELSKVQIPVALAMRYGKPSIAAGLAELKEQGCDRILAFPLYPQYAASSTASALDGVFQVLSQTRNMPEIRTIRHFHDHPGYIDALANNVREYWTSYGRPDKLLMSFHGVPRSTLERGDPYHCECQKTARLLAETLGLAPDQYVVSFQSRFGRAEWLKPYTAETLRQLGKQGVKRVHAICPGFVADCLETLEEIAMEGKTTFLNAGGSEYRYIPALNERPDWIWAMSSVILSNLQGWVSSQDQAALAETAAQSRGRALALGARD
jgi:ferrochelatase